MNVIVPFVLLGAALVLSVIAGFIWLSLATMLSGKGGKLTTGLYLPVVWLLVVAAIVTAFMQKP